MSQSEPRVQNPEVATSLIIEPRRVPGQEQSFDLSLQVPDDDCPLVCTLEEGPRSVMKAVAAFLASSFELDTGELDELICTACREAA